MDNDNGLEYFSQKWEDACKKGTFDSKDIKLPEKVSLRDDDIENWQYLSDVPDDLLQEFNLNKSKLNKAIDSMVNTASRIEPTSIGPDTDLSPGSMGATFVPEDLESLAEMKTKLHDLKVKLTTAETNDENVKSIEDKISKLEEEISELSDSLGDTFPFMIAKEK